MGFKSFSIELSNPVESYFAGQIVSGKVVIDSERPKKIRGIKLKLIGRAKTHWQESRGRSSATMTETENYIDEKVYLFGYEEEIEKILPDGKSEFYFSFQLPLNIPSSFENKHGYVKYYLESAASRHLKFDIKTRKVFTVNGILDLNAEWGASHCGELMRSKNICCLCCASGPVGFRVKLGKKGFVCGEKIGYEVNLFNMSNRRISSSKITLVQKITFYAKKKKRKESYGVVSISGPSVDSCETECWEGNNLIVPSIPPTKLGGCRIIHIEYSIEVEIEIPGGLSLKGKLPIIIGTIPFHSPSPLQFQNTSLQSQFSSNLSYDNSSSASSLPNYPDTAPPTYEEAVGQSSNWHIQNISNSVCESESESTKENVQEGGDNTNTNVQNVESQQQFLPKYVNYKSLPSN